MSWINLHIKCHNESDKVAKLRELDIPVDDDETTTEYRPFMIQSRLVDYFYPDADGGCFVMALGYELTVQEDFETLKHLLGLVD